MATIDYYVVHPTLKAAERYKENVERTYHPCGYGTTLRIEVDKAFDGSPTYIVKGYRFDSCD